MASPKKELVVRMDNNLKHPKFLRAVEDALPMTARKYMTPERVAKLALMAYRKNSYLWNCTPESVMEAVMDMAQLGLEIGGAIGQAYLVPFKDTATAIIGYRGLISLARRSGEIASVTSQVVYENDVFDLDLGSGEPPKHKPCMNGERGKMIAVYCVARFKDGGMHVEFMPKSDVDKIRSRSPSDKRGMSPWKTDYEEMAKKTVVRRAAKYWPMSTEMADALEYDNKTDGVVSVTLNRDELPEPDAPDEPAPSRTQEVLDAVNRSASKESPAEGDGQLDLEKKAQESGATGPYLDWANKNYTMDEIAAVAERMNCDPEEFDSWCKLLEITNDKRSHTAKRLKQLAQEVQTWYETRPLDDNE